MNALGTRQTDLLSQKNYNHLQVLPAQKLDGGIHGEQLTVSEEQMQNAGYHPPAPVHAVPVTDHVNNTQELNMHFIILDFDSPCWNGDHRQ